MKQEKSTHRGNLPMSEENLIQVLESFQPIPSSSFYNRTQKAPWTSRYRITRYAFQAAILMAFIVTILFINPSSMPPLFTTNTPTSTPTLGSADFPFHTPLQTDNPPSENNSFPSPSGTPSN
jgi:hypothetical protein